MILKKCKTCFQKQKGRKSRIRSFYALFYAYVNVLYVNVTSLVFGVIGRLRIIPTPWEVTLSRLLSIVSDFEREGHLKYKLA